MIPESLVLTVGVWISIHPPVCMYLHVRTHTQQIKMHTCWPQTYLILSKLLPQIGALRLGRQKLLDPSLWLGGAPTLVGSQLEILTTT